MSHVVRGNVSSASDLPSEAIQRLRRAAETLQLASAVLYAQTSGAHLFQGIGRDDRVTAVKVLKAPNTDSDRRRRLVLLKREARCLATSESRNTPRFVAVDEEGLWIAREFVAGQTLHAARKSMDKAQRRAAVQRVAAMVRDIFPRFHAYTGGAHVIRDLKPRNIVLDSAAPRAVLVDLGAVAPEGTAARAQDSKVRLGTGKWRFWAPEQLVDAERVGREADYFAFASTVFFIVTGRPVLQNSASDVAIATVAFHRDCQIAMNELRASDLALSETFLDFLVSCLAVVPTGRPRNVDLLERADVPFELS